MYSMRLSSRAWTYCRAAVPETSRVLQDVSAMMSAGCIYVSSTAALTSALGIDYWSAALGIQ